MVRFNPLIFSSLFLSFFLSLSLSLSLFLYIYNLTEVPVAKERKRALLVGCNYPGTRAELRGCVNDVWMMHKVLVEVKGFDPASIRVMIDTVGAEREREK